jgi:hypothetical protein
MEPRGMIGPRGDESVHRRTGCNIAMDPLARPIGLAMTITGNTLEIELGSKKRSTSTGSRRLQFLIEFSVKV